MRSVESLQCYVEKWAYLQGIIKFKKKNYFILL